MRIEPLTDKEKRLFLAAMAREVEICKEIDRKYIAREVYEDSLELICKRVLRKVKAALWGKEDE